MWLQLLNGKEVAFDYLLFNMLLFLFFIIMLAGFNYPNSGFITRAICVLFVFLPTDMTTNHFIDGNAEHS